MLQIIRLKKSHKAGYMGYKWAIDFATLPGELDFFPLAMEFLEVRQFCEREFGLALEYDLYYSLCSYGTGMVIPPNPYWTYEFNLAAKPRHLIYVYTDETLEKIKLRFGVSNEQI